MPPSLPPVGGYTLDPWLTSAIGADTTEGVPDLTWPQSVAVLAKMRSDPQLAAVLAAYTLPIRSAEWAVDPAGCRDEVVEQIADDLGLPILGTDPAPGSARRRGVRWAEHLRLALLHLTFGHMPFVQEYAVGDDGRARLAALWERMPTTIADITTDGQGRLESILQHGARTPIPARNLVWYVHDREGSAYQGRSLLRPAYGPWLIKHEVWRVHATSIRRFGMGVPSVTAPPGSTPQQVSEAQRLASAMRGGEWAGAGLPNGYVMALTGITGSVPDALAFIRYLDQQMAQMALASVLNLDASPNGSRALGETFVDLLHLSLNGIAAGMADTATGLAVQMVDWNWGEEEPAPRVVCGDIGAHPEVTAQSITQLIASGAVVPDDALRGWVREHWRLPDPDGTATPPGPADPDTPPVGPPVAPPPEPGTGRAPRARAVAAATRREMTATEQASAADMDAVQSDWESAVSDLLAEWGEVTAAQSDALVAQVRSLVADGAPTDLTGLSADSAAAAAALAAAMGEMAGDAVERMREEARAQGVTVDAADVAVDEDRLRSVADATAALLAAGLAGSAARRALSLWTPGATADTVGSGVAEHLTGLTDAAARDALGGALTAAQNTGRMAVVRAAPRPPVALIASEILDRSTCTACLTVDGTVFEDTDAADAAYGGSGYRDCLGGGRCRGTIVAVWDADRLPAAA